MVFMLTYPLITRASNMRSLRRSKKIKQRRWLQLLKDVDMSTLYYPGKANLVVEALSRLSMGSTAHVQEKKRDLSKDVHRLARLGVILMDST